MSGGIIDQVKERTDIVDLISNYLKLQKSGINYKARCPFHNEKSASFFVSPERQIWHCFGCNLGGDAFGFVKQIEGVEFPEALRILAARAGVELHRGNAEWERQNAELQSNKTKLLDVCELAAKFFEKQLWQSGSGKLALAYLRDRGLTDESIRKFRLGWSPENWTALHDFLSKHYGEKEIFDAGLIIKKDRGGYYDRFRSRIIFPIFDINGQVAGFTGRIFEIKNARGLTQTGTRTNADSKVEVAKYINTPQTHIYDKSRILYGLHAAKLDIRRGNRCLVVEGNMDVIMSHQAGATHVVASSGTALTDQHLKTIKRYTDNLDLCFDADNAGKIATERGVDLAIARGFNVGIIALDDPETKDPADYVKKHGAKWVEYAAQKSRPFMEYFFDTAKKSVDLATALGKKLMTEKLMPFLASMANKVEQSHWINELALALKTKEDVLYEQLSATKTRTAESPAPEQSTVRDTAQNEAETRNLNLQSKNNLLKLDAAEEAILAMVIKKPDLSNVVANFNEFLSGELKTILEKFKAAQNAPPQSGGGEIVAQLAATGREAGPSSIDFAYLKSQELWQGLEDKELEAELGKLLNQIKKRKISERLTNLEYDIKTAERAQDKNRLNGLLAEFSSLSKQLN